MSLKWKSRWVSYCSACILLWGTPHGIQGSSSVFPWSSWLSRKPPLIPFNWQLPSFWPGRCASSIFLPQGPEEATSRLSRLGASSTTNGNPSTCPLIQVSSPGHSYIPMEPIFFNSWLSSNSPSLITRHVGGSLSLSGPDPQGLLG